MRLCQVGSFTRIYFYKKERKKFVFLYSLEEKFKLKRENYKMKFVYILFCVSVVFSCKQKNTNEPAEPVEDVTVINDLAVAEKDSSSIKLFSSELNPVAYQGTFPCKDCDGIQQTILFNKDHTFQEEHAKIEHSVQPEKSYGNWAIKNNRLELTRENKPEITFAVEADTLYAVSIHNIAIKDSEKYKLMKKKLAIENPVWRKKKLSGIDFVASGNEPFWTLELRNEKDIRFKLIDWNSFVIAPLESINKTVDSTVYNLQTNNIKWSVVVYPQFCSDGMSPLLYEYKVNVFYKGVHYRGCGIMLDKN